MIRPNLTSHVVCSSLLTAAIEVAREARDLFSDLGDGDTPTGFREARAFASAKAARALAAEVAETARTGAARTGDRQLTAALASQAAEAADAAEIFYLAIHIQRVECHAEAEAAYAALEDARGRLDTRGPWKASAMTASCAAEAVRDAYAAAR